MNDACAFCFDEVCHMLTQVQQLSQKQRKKAKKGREKDRFGPPLTTRSQGMDLRFVTNLLPELISPHASACMPVCIHMYRGTDVFNGCNCVVSV